MFHVHQAQVEIEPEIITEEKRKQDHEEVEHKDNPTRQITAWKILIEFMVHVQLNKSKIQDLI